MVWKFILEASEEKMQHIYGELLNTNFRIEKVAEQIIAYPVFLIQHRKVLICDFLVVK